MSTNTGLYNIDAHLTVCDMFWADQETHAVKINSFLVQSAVSKKNNKLFNLEFKRSSTQSSRLHCKYFDHKNYGDWKLQGPCRQNLHYLWKRAVIIAGKPRSCKEALQFLQPFFIDSADFPCRDPVIFTVCATSWLLSFVECQCQKCHLRLMSYIHIPWLGAN